MALLFCAMQLQAAAKRTWGQGAKSLVGVWGRRPPIVPGSSNGINW